MKLNEKKNTAAIIKSIENMIIDNNIISSFDELHDISSLIEDLLDNEIVSLVSDTAANRYSLSLKGSPESPYCQRVYSYDFNNENDFSSGRFLIDIERDGSIEISLSMDCDFLLPLVYDSQNSENILSYLKVIDVTACGDYFSEKFFQGDMEISIVA